MKRYIQKFIDVQVWKRTLHRH